MEKGGLKGRPFLYLFFSFLRYLPPMAFTDNENLACLRWLFEKAAEIAKAHTEFCGSEHTFRPDGTTRRSTILLRRLSEGRTEKFTIVTSGINAYQFDYITKAVGDVLGQPPTITAIETGRDEPLKYSDPETRKRMDRANARYPSGVSINWTSVTGFTLHCPDQAVFAKLCEAFQSPAKSIERS